MQSQTGNASGKVTADFQSPDLGFNGELDLDPAEPGPILKEPEQRSDLTGHAKFDLTLASAPAGARALDRLRGTFAFAGPRAFAAGY